MTRETWVTRGQLLNVFIRADFQRLPRDGVHGHFLQVNCGRKYRVRFE